MTARTPLALAAALTASLVLAGCSFGRSPTTEVVHELDARPRLDDHAARLADGIARYREVQGAALPLSTRDLALTIANDGEPCFTEVLKDHWYRPYAYSPLDARSGTFRLVSAGRNGMLGDGDDLAATRGPGDARARTYGYTARAGE